MLPAPPRWEELASFLENRDEGRRVTYAGGVCAVALVAVDAFADDFAVDVSGSVRWGWGCDGRGIHGGVYSVSSRPMLPWPGWD